MQISRLNPFGYDATTDKGNNYRATNRMGVILGGVGTVLGIPQYIMSREEIRKSNEEGIFKDFNWTPSTSDFKTNKKTEAIWEAIMLSAFLLDAGIMAGIGHWIDKKTNKIRAYKADEEAEKLNTNA